MSDVLMEALYANWEYVFILLGIVVLITGYFKSFTFVTPMSSSCFDEIQDGSMMASVIFATIGLALVVVGLFGLFFDYY